MSKDYEDLLQIEWRLLNMMAERRIRTVTELRKRLIELGIDISSQQMGRLVNQFPERMNTTYLRGLLTALDCDISDLIRVHPAGARIGITNDNQVHPVKPSKPKSVKKKSKPKDSASGEPSALPPGFDD
ncbi:MAG: helix-turn-helix transcriptional regulator [Candidatus Thiodiazotropha sp.]